MINCKSVLAALLAICCFATCKKAVNVTQSVPNNNQVPVTGNIVLNPITVSGNVATLSWSKLNDSNLLQYVIVRVPDTTVNGSGSSVITVDKNTTQLIDTLPLSSYVQYYVVGELNSNLSSSQNIKSNKETYVRTDLNLFSIFPNDALYDRSSHILYIMDGAGNIMAYDVPNRKVINQINTNSTHGYCDLGTYNGKRELYVPRSDGWLFIYDAATLTQIDQLNIGGSLSEVAYNNGNLFVVYNNSGYYLSSYKRSTKAQISQTQSYIYGGIRIKTLPGTNTLFYGVSTGNNVYLISFDSSGGYSAIQSSSLPNGPTMNVFEVYPDGSNFISGSNGTIVSKSLSVVSSLPCGNLSLGGFDFDTSNHLIYAACTTKLIQAYSMNTFQLSKSINTMGYPFRVFYDNGSVFSLSNVNPYFWGSYNNHCFIEQY